MTAAIALQADVSIAATQNLVSASATKLTLPKQTPKQFSSLLVVIDPSVDDYQSLVAGVVPEASVFVLDGDRDGIEQITEILQHHRQFAHVHIVSHGSPGCVYLGTSELSLGTIDRYTPHLQAWFPPSPHPPILFLYGCNVAAGKVGAEFIHHLDRLTSAQITASTTPTGSTSLGGNWNLEVTTGRTAAELDIDRVFNSSCLLNWNHTLMPQPFKDQPAFYQTIDGQLKALNVFTGQYENIGPQQDVYNAAGYNANDNFIYAVGTAGAITGRVIRIDATGAIETLEIRDAVTNNVVTFSTNAGTVEGNNYWIRSSNNLTKIDLVSRTSQTVTFTGTTGSPADIAYRNNFFYGVVGSTLYIWNLTTQILSSRAISGSMDTGTYGAAWMDVDGNLYVSNNTSGRIYQINNYTGTSPSATLIMTGGTASTNDGIANDSQKSVFVVPIIDIDGDNSSGATIYDYQTSFTEGNPGVGVVSPDAVDENTDTRIRDFNSSLLSESRVVLNNAQAGDNLNVGTLPPSITATTDTTVPGQITVILTAAAGATPDDFELALEAITFVNSSDAPDTTPRKIDISLTDLEGNTGPASTTTINVTPVNDPPTIDLNGSNDAGTNYSTTFTENGSPVQITDTDAIATDPDGTDINTLTLTVNTVPDAANEVLTIGGATIGLVSGSGTATVGGTTFAIAATNGTVTIIRQGGGNIPNADVQTLLQGITYQNNSENPTTSNRIITVKANDGTIDSNLATSTITVQAVIDAPTLDLDVNNSSTATGSNYQTSFVEGGIAVAIADIDTAIADLDNTTIQSATITLTNPFDMTAESLSVNGTLPAGITASGYDAATGALTLTGSASLAAYQTAIAQVQYNNTSDNPTLTNRSITVVVNDGAVNSNTATTTIALAAVNDAPALDLDANDSSTATGANYRTSFTEGGAAVAIADTDVTIADPDDTNIESATITLTNRPDTTLESLSVNGTLPAGITASGYDAATGILILTGSASLAAYQTAIAQIQYNNTSDNPTAIDRSITVVVNDGTVNSNTATTTIALTAVNDAPALDLDTNDSSTATGANYRTSFTEGGAAVSIADTDITIADPDDTNIESATITLTNRPDATLESLSVNGTLPGNITASSYDPATGILTLTGSASLAAYQTAIAQIQYNNTSETPSSSDRVVTVTLSDGTTPSNTASTTITVTPTNDAPVLDLDSNDSSGVTGSNYTTRFTKGTPRSIADTDALITDVDDTNIESATINLTTLLNGSSESLSLTGAALTAANAAGITVGAYNPTTGELSLTGSASLAAYQAAIAAITYNNVAASPNPSDRTITVVINDGSSNSNTATVTIQYDLDGDGVPDAIDLDDDNDGITDADELQGNPNRDTDGDGIIDSLDLDSDNDGITDLRESGLSTTEITTLDTNGDGVIDPTNAFGTNGLADGVEVTPGSGTVDYNNDGTADTPVDTDGDTIRDFQDLDSDNDGINDVVEGGGTDTDGNGLIDGSGTDTDRDGLADAIDPSNGGTPLPVPDTDTDGRADFRDLDSDNDGLSDLTEAGLPNTADQNGDGVVDGPDGDSDGIKDLADGLTSGFGDNNGPGSSALPNGDGDATPDYRDLDSDGDNIPDRTEAGLPSGPGTPDANGDGQIDAPADTDNDGIADSIDSKPGVFGGFEDRDGDGVLDAIDLDDDNDGITDTDELQGNPNRDTDGDGIIDSLDLDADSDGLPDLVESGLTAAEIATLDTNKDGIIDATNTFGTNGLADGVEVTPGSGTVDYNNDGTADTPVDTDGDTIRDFQDLDSDNDGINDVVEGGGTDTDGNGLIDGSGTDTDRDGLADAIDPSNGGTPLPVPDTDTDSRADFRDLDSDNDGIPDLVEAGLAPTVDPDGNGVVNGPDGDGDGIQDPVDGLTTGFGDNNGPGSNTLPNTDNDTLPNYRDLDSDGDNIPDRTEAGLPSGSGTPDANGNGQVDAPADTDNDGIADTIDSQPGGFGGFEDTDGDGIPNIYDLDLDNDGILNTDEMQGNPSRDTDGDGIIDSLDLDSDNDGITDLRESGLSTTEIATLDTNGDGVIDPTNAFGTNGLADGVEVTPGSGTVDYNNDGTADTPVDTDGDTIRDFQDLDSDNDGINDVVEAGGTDADGNGLIDGSGTDTDRDGLADAIDPSNGGTPLPVPDTDTDGRADFRDLDSDNDGIPDLVEAGLAPTVDPDGNGVVNGPDGDGDGIQDPVDGLTTGFGDNNGPGSNTLPNTDNDTLPNYRDLDSDGDNIPDRTEAGLPSGSGTPDANGNGQVDAPADTDNDGIADTIDSQPGGFGGFEDTDGDGIPNVLDLDLDNDGILNTDEMQGNPNRDTDGDGIIDSLDLDSDNDGITDLRESGLSTTEIATLDTNGDGVIDPTNAFGTNGLADGVEVTPGSGTVDYNNDGTADAPVDTDGDTIRDFQDLDSDNDGINDVVEGGGTDADGNGLIDGSGTDTDRDGLADAIDPSNGGTPLPVPDTDTDGRADFRDLDSDNDGIPDLVEAGLALTVDPDGNGVVNGPDGDGDGIQDPVDGLTTGFGDNNGPGSNTLPNTDNDTLPNYRDLDSDGDAVPDRQEAGLPTGPNTPDANGNGQVDAPADTDNDGIADTIDSQPGGFGGFEDTDGDGIPNIYDLDLDNDGILNTDEMQGNPSRDTDGDGIIDSLDLDSDNDGITDLRESGLSTTEIATLDTNGDGVIDPTNAFGTNGLADGVEVTPGSGTVDYNNDGTADAPVDTDGDSVRDFQDLDSDNDGINDVVEGGGTDTDGNGLIDGSGTDTDRDGLADAIDPSTGGTPLSVPDTDTDGRADFRDLDSDNDGIPDLVEAGLPNTADQNNDGVVDGPDGDGDGIQDPVDGLTTGFGDNNGPGSNTLPNTDNDTLPNYRDLDSDGDAIPDRQEAGLPTGPNTPDANGNGQIDAPADTDNDGIPDSIDSKPGVFGGFEDKDGDGVLDAIDLDDDNDGITDADEMQGNPNRDTDGDGIIDSLDLDADSDGLPDLVESGLTAAEIATLDTNKDGIIDATNTFGTNGLADGVEVTPGSGTVDYNNDGTADTPVDTDGDTIRDFQDLDSDNDGINDVVEGGGTDTDGNGLIDGSGTDTDRDGLADAIDPSNGGTPLPVPDTDTDSRADFRDLDSDNDGIPDLVEAGLAPTVDPDGNGVVNGPDGDGDGIQDPVDGLATGFGDNNGPGSSALPNGDGDATPDYRDLDSDGDAVPDRQEAGLPTGPNTPDANGDGQVDAPADTDNDGIADSIDSQPGGFGGFEDTDGDGIPNVLDLDLDNDGILNTDEMQGNPNRDTDGDGIIDSLDLDSDNDGITDLRESGLTTTEIATLDTNGDGVIDPTNAFGTNGLADGVEVTPGSGTVDYNNDGTADTPVDTDGDTIRDFQDLDSDNDGINDVVEGGGTDADGNGLIDGSGTDTDRDGLADAIDPSNGGTPLPVPDTDTDGRADFRDLDSDNDGLPDSMEAPFNPDLVDSDRNGVIDGTDTDGDGIRDLVDSTPNAFGDGNGPSNSALGDADRDNIPDYREIDSDNDSTPDRLEAELPTGPGTPDANRDGIIDNPADTDNDGIPDSIDSNIGIFGGFDFKDTDKDGITDTSDLDDDNDGILDTDEGTSDTDTDGIPDTLDLDSDNDGIPDIREAGGTDTDSDGKLDNFTDTDRDGLGDSVDSNNGGTPLPIRDTDGDGKRDFQDRDSDNDGIPDVIEAGGSDPDSDGIIGSGTPTDTDKDGLPDPVDRDNGGTSLPIPNIDGDNVPDYQDLDSDNDGIPDVIEAGGSDPDGNGLVGTGNPIDTDGDGIPNTVDRDNGGTPFPVPDLDGDRTPDYQDLDSDNDGITDLQEQGGGLPDINKDGKVDGGDRDGDGLIDALDGDDGGFGSNGTPLPTPQDQDGNGTPDFRERPTRQRGGSQGADNVTGSDRDDILNGFSDLDILSGGNGNDIINGGSDADVIRGDAGNDVLNGGSNNDDMAGGTGNDVMNGGTGNDTMLGEDGDDLLNGGAGRDTLRGGRGNDIINGNQDNDLLFGDEDNDTLRGNRGNDILVGGFGKDKLTGGQGRDRFVYQSVQDFGDTITDFEIRRDRIDLKELFRGAGVSGSMSKIRLRQRGDDTLVQVNIGGFKTLGVLQDVEADTITRRHFLL